MKEKRFLSLHHWALAGGAALLLVGGSAAAQTPADLPKLLTHSELSQPNGRPINVHLVNSTTIGTYTLNKFLRRRNTLTTEQQRAEEEERAAITARHQPPAPRLEANAADAERLAYLMGYASAAERQALERLVQQEVRLSAQEDPGFDQQSAADKRSAFEVINEDNKQTGRIEYVRLRSSWEQPHP